MGRKTTPFLVELDILLDKYKPMFKKLEYKSLDEQTTVKENTMTEITRKDLERNR